MKPHKIVFATNNAHKITELSSQLGAEFQLVSLNEIGCFEELPETQNTLEGNALQKARFIYEKYGLDCFADDTGLLIDALNGEPGVYSARYAGEQRDSNENMDLVLYKLHYETNRNAHFKTIIALIWRGQEHLFEGEVYGEITMEKSGDKGFGYDPIFKPNGSDRTFASFTLEEKNQISHRGKAVAKLIEFLRKECE